MKIQTFPKGDVRKDIDVGPKRYSRKTLDAKFQDETPEELKGDDESGAFYQVQKKKRGRPFKKKHV